MQDIGRPGSQDLERSIDNGGSISNSSQMVVWVNHRREEYNGFLRKGQTLKAKIESHRHKIN